jgi:hypothetical protein
MHFYATRGEADRIMERARLAGAGGFSAYARALLLSGGKGPPDYTGLRELAAEIGGLARAIAGAAAGMPAGGARDGLEDECRRALALVRGDISRAVGRL